MIAKADGNADSRLSNARLHRDTADGELALVRAAAGAVAKAHRLVAQSFQGSGR